MLILVIIWMSSFSNWKLSFSQVTVLIHLMTIKLILYVAFLVFYCIDYLFFFWYLKGYVSNGYFYVYNDTFI